MRVRRWPLAAAGAVGHTRRTRLCHDRAWAQRRLDERCGWALRWDGEWRCTHRRLHAGNWLRLQPLRATFQRLAIRGSQSKRRSQERHVSTGGLGGGTAYPSCSTRRTGAKGRQRAGARISQWARRTDHERTGRLLPSASTKPKPTRERGPHSLVSGSRKRSRDRPLGGEPAASSSG